MYTAHTISVLLPMQCAVDDFLHDLCVCVCVCLTWHIGRPFQELVSLTDLSHCSMDKTGRLIHVLQKHTDRPSRFSTLEKDSVCVCVGVCM